MTDQDQTSQAIRFLLIAAALVVIVWGIYQAQSIVVMLLFAVFLAVLGIPPLLWLQQKRVPSALAAMLVVAGLVFCLLIIGLLVGASLNSFYQALPSYQTRLQGLFAVLKQFLSERGLELSGDFLTKYINPGVVLSMTTSLFSGLGSLFSNIILILLLVTFILLEASGFPVKLRAALGKPQAAFPHFAKFLEDIKRYMAIQTWVSLATGALVWLWLFILGVDFPVLWGLLAFLLNFVPNLGSIIAAIPAVLLALIQLGPAQAGLTAAGYLAINFILGNVIQPRVMGKGLGLSTLVVFLSLIFWGSLLGLIGMVLSIPMTMILKLAFESREETRWIAVLLGPEPYPKAATPIKQRSR